MAQNLVLEVRHLNSYYGQDRSILGRKTPHKQILRDVTFDIHRGEILGLVGESGCGKTTLSRVILGMLKDYDGEIIHHSLRPQMVFQDPPGAVDPRFLKRFHLQKLTGGDRLHPHAPGGFRYP